MNSKAAYFKVDIEHSGQRIDNYLLRTLKGVPKSHVYRIIRSGEVRVNKKRAKPTLRLATGDIIRLPPLNMPTSTTITPQQHRDFSWFEPHLLFEDDTLIVINKPAGLAVHGGSGVSWGVIELLRLLRPHCSNLELVHRLDRETSGCLLITKKRVLLKELHQLLRDRLVDKVYVALLTGKWYGSNTQIVTAPLQKYSGQTNERMVKISSGGKEARTQFTLLHNFASNNTCLVEARPQTGRTHQIRVHAAHLGHAIIGDDKYGNHTTNNNSGYTRLMLHASTLQFTLQSGKVYNFVAPLPSSMGDISTLNYFADS